MKIAIIGSGIAGLAAAYRLSLEPTNRVTLIERESRLGLSTQTIDWQSKSDEPRAGNSLSSQSLSALSLSGESLSGESLSGESLSGESLSGESLSGESLSGESLSGDVPSRMFNASQWPQLTKLYQQAGVESVPVKTTQSFGQCEDHRAADAGGDVDCFRSATYLRLNDALRPSIASQLLRSASREILLNAVRLRRQGRQDLEEGIDAEETLLGYLQRRRFSENFRRRFLYPTLSSTVCTCSFESLDRYPAAVILAALDRLTGPEPLRRLKHSAHDVSIRLSANVEDLRLNCEVRQVTETDSGVEICFAKSAAETFDRVIVATQANTATRLLGKIPEFAAECLAAIEYENVRVVVHQDARLMPKAQKQWATFNMVSSSDWQQAMCTVWMNRFHDDWPTAEPLFQTINPFVRIENVIAATVLQRPIVTAASQAAIAQMQSRQGYGDSKLLLAGSWADCGVPLLESGVTSAWAACERIEASQWTRVHDE